jgi:hypothetical protein
MTNRKLHLSAHLAIVASLALNEAALSAADNFLYVDTAATLSNSMYFAPVPITGLILNLPAASTAYNTAVVTLNMPNLFLSQPTSKTPMGATLQVVAPFSPAGVVSAFGGIGCDTTGIGTSAKKPLTIVIAVPLGSFSQPVEAEWGTNGSSTVSTETFASLSAVLVRQ